MRNRTTCSIALGMFCAALASGPCFAADASFVMPRAGELYMWADGGFAGADTSFGVGTAPENANLLLHGLPDYDPGEEVLVGTYSAGETVVFAMRTNWGGAHWAFSDDLSSNSALTAFTDKNNSLGWGGSVLESTGPDTYRLHLDDAASFLIDDDDNDVLIGLRVVPEPATATLLAAGGIGALLHRKRRARR